MRDLGISDGAVAERSDTLGHVENQADKDVRRYDRRECVVFRKTRAKWGGLSNMAAGFPIHLAGINVRTAEALYQACRFPHLPEIQFLILSERSPMTAKMRSKPYRPYSRQNWEKVRTSIMRWVLHVKLIYNWEKFGNLLLETGEKEIVEDGKKDPFWSAQPVDANILRGQNILGRLLMELRERLKSAPDQLKTVEPPNLPQFLLLDNEIPQVELTEKGIIETQPQNMGQEKLRAQEDGQYLLFG